MPTAPPNNFFAGDNFNRSVTQQKRAMLAAIAEHGAEGAEAFKSAKASNQSTRKAALNAAAARGAAIHAPEALQSELNTTYDSLQNVGLGDSALTHDREMSRAAAANAAFLDQIKAVGPLQEAFYDAELAKLIALNGGAYGTGGGGSGGGGGGGGGGGAGADSGSDAVLEDGTPNPYSVNSPQTLEQIGGDVSLYDNPLYQSAAAYWLENEGAGFNKNRAEVQDMLIALGADPSEALRISSTLEKQFAFVYQTHPGPGQQYTAPTHPSYMGPTATPSPPSSYGWDIAGRTQAPAALARRNAALDWSNVSSPRAVPTLPTSPKRISKKWATGVPSSRNLK